LFFQHYIECTRLISEETKKLTDAGYGRALPYHGIREHNNIKTVYAGLEAL